MSERTITFQVSGVDFTADITDEGKFVTTLDGEPHENDRLDGLKYELRDSLLARRVEVPFVSLKGTPGTMRGFHAGNKDVLVTWEDGTKARVSHYANVYRDGVLSEAEVQELRDIERQLDELRARREELEPKTEKAGDILNEAVGEGIAGFRSAERRYY
jgi:hypothetical protein